MTSCICARLSLTPAVSPPYPEAASFSDSFWSPAWGSAAASCASRSGARSISLNPAATFLLPLGTPACCQFARTCCLHFGLEKVQLQRLQHIQDSLDGGLALIDDLH